MSTQSEEDLAYPEEEQQNSLLKAKLARKKVEENY